MCVHVSHSLQLHGNPIRGRVPLVMHKNGTICWVNLGLSTAELEQRVLALTDGQCARIVK